MCLYCGQRSLLSCLPEQHGGPNKQLLVCRALLVSNMPCGSTQERAAHALPHMPCCSPQACVPRQPVQVDAKDCTGATALHRAASTGRTDIIRLLLGAKAKIDARNKDKATPLLLAAIAGHQPAAILLAGKGADVEVGDF